MHEKSCPNGCEFAKKFHLMSYANKNADGSYTDADYLYTCTKLGHTVSFDSTVYRLGCATYNYVRAEPQCICTPQPEPEPAAVIVPEPVTVVERVEPKFVPEPSVITPIAEPVVAEVPPPVPKVRKPRAKPAVTEVVPVTPAPTPLPVEAPIPQSGQDE